MTTYTHSSVLLSMAEQRFFLSLVAAEDTVHSLRALLDEQDADSAEDLDSALSAMNQAIEGLSADLDTDECGDVLHLMDQAWMDQFAA